MDLLRELSRMSGHTLVTSLHDIDFARSHYERIVGLRQGRILFDTPAAAVNPELIELLYRINNGRE
jgi:phosphonate transport system ATP-binding protein